MTNLDSILKSRDITLCTKVCIVIDMFFFISHVWMWELDHKEGLAWKNWCFWIVVLKKSLESLLDSKEIKPVNSKENQPWILIARTDTEAESLILLLSDAKSQLIGKDPDAGKDWGQGLCFTFQQCPVACAFLGGSSQPSHPFPSQEAASNSLGGWQTVEWGGEWGVHDSETSNWWCFYSPPSPASLLCSSSSIPLAHHPAATRLVTGLICHTSFFRLILA